MTIIERYVQVYEDEKRERPVWVRSFEISGVGLPREKNVPAIAFMTGCKPVFLTCSHQGADFFLAFPLSFGKYLKLLWNRIWNDGHSYKPKSARQQ